MMRLSLLALMMLVFATSADAASAIAGKPAGCPSAWCACWLGIQKGAHDHRLWAARAWAGWGHASAVVPGAVVVFPHHVVEVLRDLGGGRFIGISGNDGHAVRVRERSTAGAIAVRA